MKFWLMLIILNCIIIFFFNFFGNVPGPPINIEIVVYVDEQFEEIW